MVTRSRQPLQILVYLQRPADDDGQYLLLHRTAQTGGFWQGVSGGLEAAETAAEAAWREVHEETSLQPLTLAAIDYSYRFPVPESMRHLYTPAVDELVQNVFLARVAATGEPTISHEHDDWRWCSLEQALALLYWPEDREALRRCHQVARDGTWF